MEERLLNIYNGVMEDNDLDQVSTYFNDRCYLIKKDFGLLVSHFIETSNVEMMPILNIIFNSKKFKDQSDCCDKYGEPIVHLIIYTIAGKLHHGGNVDYLMSLLKDPNLPLRWNLNSESLDSPLHVIASECETLGSDLTWELLTLALQKGCNPLCKNDADLTAMQILRYDILEDNVISDEERNEMIKVLEKNVKKHMITISSKIYEVEEEIVEVESTVTTNTPTMSLVPVKTS